MKDIPTNGYTQTSTDTEKLTYRLRLPHQLHRQSADRIHTYPNYIRHHKIHR